MANDCFSSHCKEAHGWRAIPCTHDYCKYEAFSETSHKIHVNSHNRKSNLQKPNFYCTRGDCGKAFTYIQELIHHTQLHDNNLLKCHYCPWRGARNIDLNDHMNHHFLIRPFKCSFCESSFYISCTRNQHENDIHEKILDRYKCDKCQFISHSRAIYYQHKREKH